MRISHSDGREETLAVRRGDRVVARREEQRPVLLGGFSPSSLDGGGALANRASSSESEAHEDVLIGTRGLDVVSLSELCHIPRETPVNIVAPCEVLRCSGKRLIRRALGVLVCLSDREEIRFPSVLLQPLGHLSALESTSCERRTTLIVNCEGPPNLLGSLAAVLLKRLDIVQTWFG